MPVSQEFKVKIRDTESRVTHGQHFTLDNFELYVGAGDAESISGTFYPLGTAETFQITQRNAPNVIAPLGGPTMIWHGRVTYSWGMTRIVTTTSFLRDLYQWYPGVWGNTESSDEYPDVVQLARSAEERITYDQTDENERLAFNLGSFLASFAFSILLKIPTLDRSYESWYLLKGASVTDNTIGFQGGNLVIMENVTGFATGFYEVSVETS